MTDDRMERIIGKLLISGVAAAAAIVLGGGIWYLTAHGLKPVSYHIFQADCHVWSGRSGAETIILAGLLVLIATPVARVAFALVAFALERDRTFVGICLIVLAVLIYSLAA